ncbi:hypothetical protein [Zavarzinia aquatilis]|uniref:Uncharacterized protein n=1 Tax=Zavarzinia aquatilis TaxID=2211142 RepID=A0A317EDX0_9PROT|nr:hypothetical protein [Zavarzinia aquatilis]PWR24951.1 hypothetical protein DKG74_04065 [Zavarzinia aquatilis]
MTMKKRGGSKRKLMAARTKAARAFADWAGIALETEQKVEAVTDLAEDIRDAFARFDAALIRNRIE